MKALGKIVLIILCIFATIECSNYRPVIAILSLPKWKSEGFSNYETAGISVTYVKWLEASGADFVPINPWVSEEDLIDIMDKVNGVIFQGSFYNQAITPENIYIDIATAVFGIIAHKSEKGIEIPVFGICHGFQLLHYLISGENYLQSFKLMNVPAPLIFDNDRIKTTRLYSMLDDKDFKSLAEEPVTAHFHNFGVSPKVYERDESLSKFFRITTTALDDKDNLFISSVEAYDRPVYATQYHPEVVPYLKNPDKNIPTSPEAIRIARSLGNFFVKECSEWNLQRMNEEDREKYQIKVEPAIDADTKTYIYSYKKPTEY